MREVDPVAERLLGRTLQPDVERQLERVARPGLAAELEVAHLVPERVDAYLGPAVFAAEIGVERRLDPGLADPVSRAIAVASKRA